MSGEPECPTFAEEEATGADFRALAVRHHEAAGRNTGVASILNGASSVETTSL